MLLLLHGLGATADVWAASVLDEHWPGRWVAPDLPGHGGSRRLARYTFGALAAAAAEAVDGEDPVTVVGHSLGGVVGLALASGWFGVEVDTVVGVGIKVAWSADELTKAASLATRQAATFGSRDEAVSRHLRLSGLAGLVEPDSPSLASGVIESDGQWRLALDMRAFAVGAPDMPSLLAASRAGRVVLARGEHDAMVTEDQLRELRDDAVTVAGFGHNAHVEDLPAVLRLLDA
jgi:pimeloyl-ACP methyl ester carboxylesterase